MSDVISNLTWRYATKKFDPARKLSAETWATLEQALILSPSSFGLQPWKFLVITDAAVKARLVPISWGQTQPADAIPHLIHKPRRAACVRPLPMRRSHRPAPSPIKGRQIRPT